MGDPRHWVLWDGDCSICSRSSDWIRRKDTASRLRVVPYQEAPSPPMTPELSEACRHAVHVVTSDGRVLRSGRASMFILRQVGWPVWILAVPPFIWAVELIYRLVARNRSHISCKINPKPKA